MPLALPASYKTGTATVKGAGSATVTMTIASPAVASWTAHGLSAGDPVKFATTGALPTGLTAGTTYYVIAAGLVANAFEVSATPGGAAINTSGSQSGTQTASTVGSTLVTGSGTAWVLASVQVGDTFEGVDGKSAEILSVTDDTHLVLDRPWPGSSQSAAYYRIAYADDGSRALEKARQVIEELSVVGENAAGLFYKFSASLSGDPGSNNVALDNALVASALFIRVSNNDANNPSANISDRIDEWSTGDELTIRATDGSARITYLCSSAPVDETGYRQAGVTYVGKSGIVSDGATVVIERIAKGEAGIGVPVGGTTGQVLAKASNADDDTHWVTSAAGGGSSAEIIHMLHGGI